MLAQLPPRVVQRLVQRAAGRPQPVGEHVDRHAVDRQGDQDLPLVRRQHVVHRPLHGREQLALLDLLVRCAAGAREHAPCLRLERQLAALPRALAQLDGCLEQRELVDPGREPARAAIVVEPRQHAHERVVRGLVSRCRRGRHRAGGAAIGRRRATSKRAARSSSACSRAHRPRRESRGSPRSERSHSRDSGSSVVRRRRDGGYCCGAGPLHGSLQPRSAQRGRAPAPARSARAGRSGRPRRAGPRAAST